MTGLLTVLIPIVLSGQFVIDPYRFAAGGGGSVGIARTDLDTTSKNTTSGSASWTDMNIGAADESRVVVVVWWVRIAGFDWSSMTASIGGESATILHSFDQSGDRFCVAIAWAAVPTGTTATVSVTVPATSSTNAMAVYRMIGCSDTATDTGSVDSALTLNDTLTTVTGGIVIGSGVNSQAGPSATWSGGVTEDLDGDFATADTYTSAFGDATGASMTPQVVFGSGTASAAAFVSFSPL